MTWMHRKIVAFDTETTGLNPAAGDRIIEFAAVVFERDPAGNYAIVAEPVWLVHPEIPIPRKVTELTGITDEAVAKSPPFRDIASEVFRLLDGAVAVAHNFPFDLAMLAAEFRALKAQAPEPAAELDTVDLSIATFPEARNHRLADLAQRLDVPLVRAHRAVEDARACGQCFIKMLAKADVADDLQALQAWANGTGWPPEGPLTRESGRTLFASGPHAGRPPGEHPLYLAWLEMARERTPNGWRHQTPEGTRSWIRRWLSARGTGRSEPTPKTIHEADWVTDSCATADRSTDARLRGAANL